MFEVVVFFADGLFDCGIIEAINFHGQEVVVGVTLLEWIKSLILVGIFLVAAGWLVLLVCGFISFINGLTK
jgi:hypothetical protein